LKNLEVNLGPLTLKNPVMTASGTAGYGEEISRFLDISRLGAFVMKGISLKPWEGNPPPRITETPAGMLNAIGLQNVGLKVFLKEKLPFIREYNVPVIANILGNTIDEYEKLAAKLDGEVQGIEVNISCPNVKRGGIAFGTDRKACAKLVKKVRKRIKKSLLIVKLSPVSVDIAESARAMEDLGADAISLINTFPAMAININNRRPVLANKIGGLSGPAIKPIAIRMVYQAARAVKIPIIGMGGIMTGEDAVEFLLAGATAVAVGTATFRDPRAPLNVLDGLEAWIKKKGVEDVNTFIRGVIE
jgi:dihydroorotate dehydrogenase (NAD+) catalytic subunit